MKQKNIYSTEQVTQIIIKFKEKDKKLLDKAVEYFFKNKNSPDQMFVIHNTKGNRMFIQIMSLNYWLTTIYEKNDLKINTTTITTKEFLNLIKEKNLSAFTKLALEFPDRVFEIIK